jgi:hypothetical protein
VPGSVPSLSYVNSFSHYLNSRKGIGISIAFQKG